MSKNLKHNLKGMSTNLKQNLKRYAHQFKKKIKKGMSTTPTKVATALTACLVAGYSTGFHHHH